MDGVRLLTSPATHLLRRAGLPGLLLAAVLLALPGTTAAQNLQVSLEELADRLHAALLNPVEGSAPVVDATPSTPPPAVAAPVVDATPSTPPAASTVETTSAAGATPEAAATPETAPNPQPDPVQAEAVQAASAPAVAALQAETAAPPATDAPQSEAAAPAPVTETAASPESSAPEAAPAPAAELAPAPPPVAPAGAPAPVQSVALGSAVSTPDGVLIVAVADFQNLSGDVCDLGRYTAERMVTTLAAKEGLRVLPRRRLREVLRETELGSPDLLTTADLETLGAALPAHALLMGALTDLGPTLELDLRALALHDGSTRFAGFAGFNKTVALDDLREENCTPAMDEEPNAEAIAATEEAAQPLADGTAAPAAVEASPPPPLPAYETPQYRLVVESVTRLDDSVTILMTVENLTQSALAVSFRIGSYLLDENGDRWNQMFPDTARLWAWGDDFKLVELLPGLQRRTKLRYQALAGAKGEVFSLIGEEYRPQSGRVITIPEIKLTPYTLLHAGAAPREETRGSAAP